MAVIVNTNGDVRIAEVKDRAETLSTLGAGVYLLSQDIHGFYLSRKDDFRLPGKIYGERERTYPAMFLKSHNAPDREGKNMTLLLSGTKGTGKTIMAKNICIQSGQPVIIISTNYTNNAFVDYISSKEFKDCIFFIDEYEKVYKSYDEQNALLGILDGAMSGANHNLFILTCNQMNISEYMINRPGRIYYRVNYDTLPTEIVREMGKDMLLNDESGHKLKDLLDFFLGFEFATYDIVGSIIREMNHFNESARKCANRMCLSNNERASYDAIEIFDGKAYALSGLSNIQSPIAAFKPNNDGEDIETIDWMSRPCDDKTLEARSYYKIGLRGHYNDDQYNSLSDEQKSKITESRDEYHLFRNDNLRLPDNRIVTKKDDIYVISFPDIPNYHIELRKRSWLKYAF